MRNIELFASPKLVWDLFHLIFRLFAGFIHWCHHDCSISYIAGSFSCKCSKGLWYFQLKNEHSHDSKQDLIHFLYNIILFMSIEDNKFELNSLILIIFCQRFEFLTVIKSHFLDLFVSLTLNLFLSLLEQNFDHFAAFILDEKYSFISSTVISDCQNILIFHHTVTTVRSLNIYMNLLQCFACSDCCWMSLQFDFLDLNTNSAVLQVWEIFHADNLEIFSSVLYLNESSFFWMI